ncbi:MAG: 6-phosphogluconolactonase [Thalassotalea sp.]
MYQLNEFIDRSTLDQALADNIATILTKAIKHKGKASIAVSGGSTPKGLFKLLSEKDLSWDQVTITLADERWVDISSDASNTRLVHENLLVGKAAKAHFFHIKQGEELNAEVLSDLIFAADSKCLPFDVLILGMGEDGHTASLFPCSEQIDACFSPSTASLLKVKPTTAPHDRISFSFHSLIKSENIFLHICGDNKKPVLEKALSGSDVKEMPIRGFLQHPTVNTNIYWSE